MKKFFIIGTALCLFSCGSEERTSEAKKKVMGVDTFECIVPPPLNPNGDSELALLMREMASTTEKIKTALENKAEIPPYPAAFEKIYFAKKTEPENDGELFNGLANSYIQSVKRFYAVTDKNKKTSYNAMVNSCVSCHENFCGGPIKRIRKLLIAE